MFEEHVYKFGVAFLSKIQKIEPTGKAPWADLSTLRF